MTQASEDAIARFWDLWTRSRADIERAIEERTLAEWVDRLGAHVKAIDGGLDWELGRGVRAQHYFCVSATGDMSRRVVAERWRAHGPPDDDVFEYHAARPGGGYVASHEIAFGEHAFRADAFRFVFEIDSTRRAAHVRVWHPSFARVERDLAGTATMVMLDAVLGEDEVDRWIGGVDLVDVAPPEGVSFAELVDTVEGLRETEETFTILRGELPGGDPIFASVNLGLKRVDHLLMDLHVELALTLRSPTPQGLTTPEEAAELNAAEDALLASLGHDAIFVGRETARGHRVIHLHAASGGPAIARIDEWASRAPWPVEVQSRLDPQWDVLRRW